MNRFMKSLLFGEDGATMVEYALMVALIAAAAVAAVTALGGAMTTKFTTVSGNLG